MSNKKIIKLNESDLENIIQRVIEEDAKEQKPQEEPKKKVIKITESDIEKIEVHFNSHRF